MEVNFTGMSNICSASGIDKKGFYQLWLSAKLDNKNTKHLTKYSDILKKYPNPLDKNTVTIALQTKPLAKRQVIDLFINDKKIERTRESKSLIERVEQFIHDMCVYPCELNKNNYPDNKSIFNMLSPKKLFNPEESIANLHNPININSKDFEKMNLFSWASLNDRNWTLQYGIEDFLQSLK